MSQLKVGSMVEVIAPNNHGWGKECIGSQYPIRDVDEFGLYWIKPCDGYSIGFPSSSFRPISGPSEPVQWVPVAGEKVLVEAVVFDWYRRGEEVDVSLRLQDRSGPVHSAIVPLSSLRPLPPGEKT